MPAAQSGSLQWLDALDAGKSDPGSGEDVVTQGGWMFSASTTTPDWLGSGDFSGGLSGDFSGELPEDDSHLYGSGEVTITELENLTALPQIKDTLNDELLTEAFAIITMVIAVIGTLGNMIAVVILCRRSMKHIWISAFLMTLCMADTVGLWAYFLECLAQMVSSLLHTWLCKIVTLVSTSAGLISSWSIVAMCIHLALNVTDPFIGQISQKTLYKIVCILTCIPIGLCLHLLWTTKLDDVLALGCVYDTKYSLFITVWGFIDVALTTYIPVLIIVISIVVISYKRKNLPATDINIKIISLDITRLCFITSQCFVMFTIVSAVLTTCIKYIHNDYKHGPSRRALYEDQQYSDLYAAHSAFLLLSYLRKAINLIIFTCAGNLFHEEVNLVLCCRNSSDSKKYRYESTIYDQDNSSTWVYAASKDPVNRRSSDASEAQWNKDELFPKSDSIGSASTYSDLPLIGGGGGLRRVFQESIKSAVILMRQKSNDTASMEFDPLQSSRESLGNVSPDEGFIGVFSTDSGSETSSNSEQNLFPMISEEPVKVGLSEVIEGDLNEDKNCEVEVVDESENTTTVEEEIINEPKTTEDQTSDDVDSSSNNTEQADKDIESIGRDNENNAEESKRLSDLSSNNQDSILPKQVTDLIKYEEGVKDSWRESGIVSDSDDESQNEALYEENGAEVERNKLERNVSWASPLVKGTRKKSHDLCEEEMTRF